MVNKGEEFHSYATGCCSWLALYEQELANETLLYVQVTLLLHKATGKHGRSSILSMICFQDFLIPRGFWIMIFLLYLSTQSLIC